MTLVSSLFTGPHMPFKVQLENLVTFAISVIIYVLKTCFLMMSLHIPRCSHRRRVQAESSSSLSTFHPPPPQSRYLPLWRSRKQVRTVLQQGSRLGTTLSSPPIFAPAFWPLQRDVEAWPLRYSTCWVSLSGRGILSRGLWAWGSGTAFSKTT